MNKKELLSSAGFKIFCRGKDYFGNGRIRSFITDPNTRSIIAKVRGNGYEAPYTVCIELDSDDKVMSHSCTCPYGSELVCKHLVAVLLMALEGDSDSRTMHAQGLSEQSKEAPSVDDAERYRRAISECIDNHTDQGWIDSDGCASLCTRFRKDLHELRGDEKCSRISLFRYILEVLKALDDLEGNVDDHYGDLEDLNRIYLDSLGQTLAVCIAVDNHDEIVACYREILGAAEKLSPSDTGESLYELAAQLTHIDNGDRMFASLEKLAREDDDPSPVWGGRIKPANKLRYYRYLKAYKPEQASTFLQNNLQHQDFRNIAIDEAIAANNYVSAERLCLEVVEKENDLSQWERRQFRERLVRVYELADTGESTDKLVALADDLCFDDGRESFYRVLKETHQKRGTWVESRKSVLAKVVDRFSPEGAIRILLEEDEMQAALSVLGKAPNLVYRYGEIFSPCCSNEIYAAFVEDIRNSTRFASHNGKYHELCEKLIVMEKVCGVGAVLPVIEELQQTYRQRRNMQKDLRNLVSYMKYKQE